MNAANRGIDWRLDGIYQLTKSIPLPAVVFGRGRFGRLEGC